jgi:hypothetical protein
MQSIVKSALYLLTSFLITILFDHYRNYNREQDDFHGISGRGVLYDDFSLTVVFLFWSFSIF